MNKLFTKERVVIALISAVSAIVLALITTVGTLAGQAQKQVGAEIGRQVQDLPIPIGTIVPFFGNPASLNSSLWLLCDGQDVGPDMPIEDANPEKGGKQLPDLRGRFLQGLSPNENILGSDKKPHTGGQDNISAYSHKHEWASFSKDGKSGQWASFDKKGQPTTVSDYENGIPFQGDGIRPLATKGSKASKAPHVLFSAIDEHDHGKENRPAFMKAHWIMRVGNPSPEKPSSSTQR